MKFAREIESIMGGAAGYARLRGWAILNTDYPDFSVVLTHPTSKRRVGFRFHCDNWDELPPSLILFDSETQADLTWPQWPQGGWAAGDNHPTTGKPFLCLPGIREYHTHTSHTDDRWDNYRSRGTYTLGHIVARVQQRFGATNG